jgi:hypothetical protein
VGIVQRAVQGSIKEVTTGRLVCQSFCSPAGALVQTLQCNGGRCDITSEAWNSFPNADGLRIDGDYTKRWLGEQALVQLFSRIPSKRLRRFALFNSDIQKHASHMAAALISTPFTRQLRQVSISSTVLPMEADALLEGLPDLEELELKVKGQGKFVRKPWAPPPGQHLRRLKLSSEKAQAQRPLRLDMAGVAANKQLQCLHLHCVTAHNWRAIRAAAGAAAGQRRAAR